MIVKKGSVNSSYPPEFLPRSSFEMSLSVLGNELDYQLGDSGKVWASSFKVERSAKMFEKKNNTFLKQGSTGQVNKVFKPMRKVLLFFGRFPFSPSVQGKGLSSPKFAYTMKTFHWIYFIVTSLFLFFVLIASTIGFANFFLDWDLGPAKTEFHDDEKATFTRNLVPFVLFWGCLAHAAVANFSFITNRKKIVDYFNNWNVVVDILSIDLRGSLGRFMLYANIWLISFVSAFLVFFAFDIAPIARGVSALVANLVMRLFVSGNHNLQDYQEVSSMSIFGIFTLVYGIYGSRAMLFVYLFQSQLLRHSFKIWNGRLKEEIYKDHDDENPFIEKIVCEKLYRDHYILVRIVKQTDSVFGTMLQAYYGTQILNMCFELYFLARSSQFGSDTSDIIVAAILFGQTVSFFFTVSLDAAYVNEEAMKGFEILRSRGLRADDSSNRKHLIYSLEMSYSQRIVLTGGKFFSVDRPFIVTVLGAVFTYFVIILQFGSQITDGSTV